MNPKLMINYAIGVDGGGTSTRVRLQGSGGNHLGAAQAGPSGLAHGVAAAWHTIGVAIDAAFASAALPRPPNTEIGLGLGLAGVHNPQCAAQFLAQNPGFGALALDTDAFTALLGAHQGDPGAIIVLGTGSVAEALLPNQERRVVAGWGFPAGDEASGAWIGLSAVSCAQQAHDGRACHSPFTHAVFQACGGSREAFFAWLAHANQTRFGELAPLVFKHATSDAAAQQILHQAALEVAKMAIALDPKQHLPLALYGGMAEPMRHYLPARLQARLQRPKEDAVSGALILLRRHLKNG